jgi:hypothetical protein
MNKPPPIPKADPLRRAERRKTGQRFLAGFFIACAAVFSFVYYAVLAHPVPWKATDPASPRFNPAAFAFRDYETTATLDAAARGMFPKGTQKATVDRILHDIGHADAKLFSRTETTVQYAYVYSVARSFFMEVLAWIVTPPDQDRRWFVLVRFDAGGRVVDVSATVADHDEVGARAFNRILTTPTTDLQ